MDLMSRGADISVARPTEKCHTSLSPCGIVVPEISAKPSQRARSREYRRPKHFSTRPSACSSESFSDSPLFIVDHRH